MILVVLDTNILVSAFRKPEGNEAAVLDMVWARALRPSLSPAIMAEYRDVLTRPHFQYPVARVASVLGLLEQESLVLIPAAFGVGSPDPDDTKFIACAMAARAQFLVTGNCRHFPEPAYGAAEVASARQLLDRLATRA